MASFVDILSDMGLFINYVTKPGVGPKRDNLVILGSRVRIQLELHFKNIRRNWFEYSWLKTMGCRAELPFRPRVIMVVAEVVGYHIYLPLAKHNNKSRERGSQIITINNYYYTLLLQIHMISYYSEHRHNAQTLNNVIFEWPFRGNLPLGHPLPTRAHLWKKNWVTGTTTKVFSVIIFFL